MSASQMGKQWVCARQERQMLQMLQRSHPHTEGSSRELVPLMIATGKSN